MYLSKKWISIPIGYVFTNLLMTKAYIKASKNVALKANGRKFNKERYRELFLVLKSDILPDGYGRVKK